MKSKEQIEAKIEEIQNSDLLTSGTVTIDINAPVALMQMEAEGVIKALKWVLKE